MSDEVTSVYLTQLDSPQSNAAYSLRWELVVQFAPARQKAYRLTFHTCNDLTPATMSRSILHHLILKISHENPCNNLNHHDAVTGMFWF
jgi:hypothetical protein